MNIKIIIIIIVVCLLAALGVVLFGHPSAVRVSSISDGNAYSSIMTGVSTSFPTAGKLVRIGAGTLGSVVITGTGTGNIDVYDATTTDVNLRAGATTTLTRLASFGPSATVGTYVFDSAYSYGLIVAVTGVQASTTITYR